jgi:pyruvate formate lyase activating enzyme
MRIFYKGFNFSEDGPGNRLVYHLSGCNLKCPWCSNPEGMDISAGTDIPVSEIIKESISCKPMFFSSGGVTFTGGEATLQHKELLKALIGLKENGIHTAIETNGTSILLEELLPYIDWLIMDFKHFDGDVLKWYTGIDNTITKLNFEKNCKNRRQQHVRIPLINGFNADSPEKFIEYFKMHDTGTTTFELLPYHEYGKEKWKTEYKITDGFISKETLLKFQSCFKENGLIIVNT